MLSLSWTIQFILLFTIIIYFSENLLQKISFGGTCWYRYTCFLVSFLTSTCVIVEEILGHKHCFNCLLCKMSLFLIVLKLQTLYQVSVLLVLNFRGRSLLNLENDKSNHANEVKNTLIFNSFVLCQVILTC